MKRTGCPIWGVGYGQGRWVLIRPNRGFAGDPTAGDVDEELEAWTPKKETVELVERWGRIHSSGDETGRSADGRPIEMLLRRIAIESGEAEREYGLQEDGKVSIAENGWDAVRERHQRLGKGIPWHGVEELRRRLVAIGEAVVVAWRLGRTGSGWVSKKDLEQIHARLMEGRRKGRRPWWMPVAAVNPYERGIEACVRMRPAREAEGILDRIGEKVDEELSDPAIPTARIAAKAHACLWHAHPWGDGNSRTSRALVTGIYAARGEVPPILRAARSRHEAYKNALFAGFHRKGRRGTSIALARHIEEEHVATLIGIQAGAGRNGRKE